MGRNHPQGAVTLDLNELLVKRPTATYFVRVEGDSMVGAGISEISPGRRPSAKRMP